jgi:hypothetical protein
MKKTLCVVLVSIFLIFSGPAAEAGVVDELLPLPDIAEALVRCVKGA